MTDAKVVARSFSPAFRRMCEVVAIGETRSRQQTLKVLVLHSFEQMTGEGFATGAEVSETLLQLYGLDVPATLAQSVLDDLVDDSDLLRTPKGTFALAPEKASAIREVIESARRLEEEVKAAWLNEIEEARAGLLPETLWGALQAYLYRAFRRHGIQATSLLSPGLESSPEDEESLSFLLDDALHEAVSDETLRPAAGRLVSGFLGGVAKSEARLRYITQLADGAFTYYSLTVPPEVADSLRTSLQPLELFLDTNFLYGVLRLGENVSYEVTHELIDAIQIHGFPFRLRCHQRTNAELTISITHHETTLKSWPLTTGLARAALDAPHTLGVIRHFLREYLATGTAVDQFFRPFRHFDELLRDGGIEPYVPDGDALEERTDVLHDYTDFLKQNGRHKRYELVEHDATLLQATRALGRKATSSLDLGALLLTYDFYLYRFEWRRSRAEGRVPCVVLPNMFWQVLRPFVPADPTFDRSFAETFALPEFRTVASDVAAASTRLLGLLASYRNVAEGTARRLLSNDLLIDQLRHAESKEKFEELVAAEFVKENVLLSEELQLLRRDVQAEQELNAQRAETLASTEGNAERLQARVRALEDTQATLNERVAVQDQLELENQDLKSRAEQLRAEKQRAEQGQDSASGEANRLRSKVRLLQRVAAISTVAVVALLGWLAASNWGWLHDQPRFAALRSLIVLELTLLTIGAFYPRRRKYLWYGSGGALALVAAIILLI
jgi:hypothetical protein